MLGLINSIVSLGGAVDKYIRNGLVMANRFTLQGLNFPVQGSAEFNGTSDYIQLDTLNDYSGYTGLTISTWMYSGDLTSNKTIASNWGDNTNNNFGWLIFTGQFVDYRITWLVSDNGINYNQLDSGTNLNENQWYYVTCVWESGSAKIYIDGSLDGSDTSGVPTSIYGTDFPTIIGADFDGSGETLFRTFDGNLANFAIWNRVLSSDEINSVMWKSYDSLLASEKSGLQAWYRLQESELLAGDDTATLTTYAAANSLTFEGAQCVQDALNALPTADAGRVLFDAYDTRVTADSGSTEARTCTINELNAIL